MFHGVTAKVRSLRWRMKSRLRCAAPVLAADFGIRIGNPPLLPPPLSSWEMECDPPWHGFLMFSSSCCRAEVRNYDPPPGQVQPAVRFVNKVLSAPSSTPLSVYYLRLLWLPELWQRHLAWRAEILPVLPFYETDLLTPEPRGWWRISVPFSQSHSGGNVCMPCGLDFNTHL